MFECPTYKFESGYLPAWRVALFFVSAFANLFVSITAFFFVGSIFSRKRVYTNTLNLYVAFLLLPDAWNNFQVAVYGFFEVNNCGFSQEWRVVYEFTIFFYFFCNFYLNVFVAHEIYGLLEKSSRREKARPPPLKRGILQIAIVYFLAFLLGMWAVLDVPWSFFDRGSFGSPDGGPFTTLDAYILVGVLITVPLLFILYFCIKIKIKGLMPKDGKTRSVSIFFGRIIVIFFACYLPGVAVNIFATTLNKRSMLYFWMERTNQFLYILQSVTTMYMISFKGDIWKVVCDNFRVCTCQEQRPPNEVHKNSIRRPNWTMGSSNNNHRSSVTDRTGSLHSADKTANSVDRSNASTTPTDPKMESSAQQHVPEEESIEIRFANPEEPLDIVHPSIDDDEEDGEEHSVWVGKSL